MTARLSEAKRGDLRAGQIFETCTPLAPLACGTQVFVALPRPAAPLIGATRCSTSPMPTMRSRCSTRSDGA